MTRIDRTPQGLVDALSERIEKLLQSSFWYPSSENEEEFRTPKVFRQLLPITLTSSPERDNSKDYPIVQVVCTQGLITDFSETSNGSEITIQLIFGGHSTEEDNQGWRIPMAMLWYTLMDLLSNTICNGYQLDTPIKYNPIYTVKQPYYHANIETTWKGCPPALEVPEEDTVLRKEENQN